MFILVYFCPKKQQTLYLIPQVFFIKVKYISIFSEQISCWFTVKSLSGDNFDRKSHKNCATNHKKLRKNIEIFGISVLKSVRLNLKNTFMGVKT